MNVNIAIATVPLALASTTQVLGDWIINVSVITGDVTSLYKRIDSATPSTVLEDVPPGSYSVTAQRFDNGGNAFGDQVSASFSVAEPEVTEESGSGGTMESAATGDAAASITVTLS